MVDALRETWRALDERGLLVDLRPLPSPACPLEVVTADGAVEIGEIDTTGALAHDLAADRAVVQVLEAGLFARRSLTCFTLEYAWGGARDLAAYVARSRAVRGSRPPLEELMAAFRERRARTRGNARLRYRRPMHLAVYEIR